LATPTVAQLNTAQPRNRDQIIEEKIGALDSALSTNPNITPLTRQIITNTARSTFYRGDAENFQKFLDVQVIAIAGGNKEIEADLSKTFGEALTTVQSGIEEIKTTKEGEIEEVQEPKKPEEKEEKKEEESKKPEPEEVKKNGKGPLDEDEEKKQQEAEAKSKAEEAQAAQPEPKKQTPVDPDQKKQGITSTREAQERQEQELAKAQQQGPAPAAELDQQIQTLRSEKVLQMEDLQKRYDRSRQLFEYNLKNAGDRDTREQIIQGMNTTLGAQQVAIDNIKQDIRALDLTPIRMQQEQALKDIPLQLANIKDPKHIETLLKNEGVDVTPKTIETRRQAELDKLRTLAEQASKDEKEYESLKILTNSDVKSLLQETPRTRYDNYNAEILQDKTWQGVIDKSEINKMNRSNNPLDALGIDTNNVLTKAEVEKAYKDKVKALYLSDDPEAKQALSRLDRDFKNFIDQVDDKDTTAQIKQKADFRYRKLSRAQAIGMREMAKYASENTYTGIGKKWEFSLRDWSKEKQDEYYRRKGQAAGSLLTGGVMLAAGAIDKTLPDYLRKRGIKGVTADIARGAGRATKRTAIRMYSSKFNPVRVPINKWNQSRTGKWVNSRPKAAFNIMKKLDQKTAGFIVNRGNINVTFSKYVPNKRGWRVNLSRNTAFVNKRSTNTLQRYNERKSERKRRGGIQTLVALKALYDVTIGRFFNAARNVARIAGDTVYTKTGLKAFNNQRKILTSKISTKFWSGAGGKTVINAQRALNGVRAVMRAIPAGLQSSAITAGIMFLLPGGQISPLIVALAGVTGMSAQVVKDTLTSTRPSAVGFIRNFQAKYGTIQRYGVTGGSIGPAPLGQDMRNGITRRLSIARAINPIFVGAGIGTLIGALLGNPALGMFIGGATTGALSLARDEITNRLWASAANRPWMQILAKMPFLEAQGLITAIPWMNRQWNYIKSGQFGALANEWTLWKNPFTTVSNFLHGGMSIHSVKVMWSWASTSVKFAGAMRAASIGMGIGTVVGAGVALIFGLPLGAGLVVGGFIGGIVGTVIGSFWGPIGVYIGSFVGSFLGSTIGAFIDNLLGKANTVENMLKALFGTLNLIKGFMDLINSLGKKFDPTTMFGIVLTLVFGLATLAEMAEQYSNADLGFSTGNSATASSTTGEGSKTAQVQGANLEVYDCKTTRANKLTNPSTSIVTSIQEKNGIYSVKTKESTFVNLYKLNSGMELNGTIFKGKIVGYCNI